jgi:hypothetical protein
MEFNADLVAVSVCGSDAPIHALFRSDFAQACRQQAEQDLALAAEHQLFTSDLFFHQHRAALRLRILHGKPDLGRLPADSEGAGRLFEPGGTAAPMWDDHPSHYDREQNMRRRYWPSPGDDRPAWVLFCDQPALREEVTLDFYSQALGLELEPPLAEPEVVQAFIDAEHASGSVDPRYHGVYDDRFLEIEDFEQALRDAGAVATPERVADALAELEAGLPAWVAGHKARIAEWELLQRIATGQVRPEGNTITFRDRQYPASEAGSLLERVQAELEEDRRYLARFDRSVFTLHHRLAEQQGKQDEFRERYRFHLQLEKLMQKLAEEQGQLAAVLNFVVSRVAKSGELNVQWGELHQVVEALQQVHRGFAAILEQAGQLTPPAMKHLPSDEPLGRYLPQAPAVRQLDSVQYSFDFGWCERLQREMAAVHAKLARIRGKSLVGILGLQEQLPAQSRLVEGNCP